MVAAAEVMVEVVVVTVAVTVVVVVVSRLLVGPGLAGVAVSGCASWRMSRLRSTC